MVNALAVVSGVVCDGAKHPARPRSPPRWTPVSWATGCTGMETSSLAGTESSPRAWKIPFGMLAAWPGEGMKETDKEIIKIMLE